MAETRFMETVLFGGYERSAVEKKFEFLTEQICSLKNELRESKLLLTEMKKGTEAAKAAEEILDGERAKLTQVQVQHESVSKKLRVAEDDVAARDAEIKELKEKIAELQDQLNEKTFKLTSLEAQNDAEALSAVFIEAQKSATLLVETAKKEAAALEANSHKLADNLIAEANNTAKKLVFDAETKSAEILADAGNRSNQMEAATDNLRATVLANVQKLVKQVTLLKTVFDTFQQNGIDALAEAEDLLLKTEESMKAGGVPEFHEPLMLVPDLPQEPGYAPVDHTYFDEAAEASRQQMNDELKRLQDMANSLVSGQKPAAEAPAEAAEQTNKNEKKNGKKQKDNRSQNDTVKQMVPDLAALAAQADALAKGSK